MGYFRLYRASPAAYKCFNLQRFLSFFSVAGWSSLVARRAHNPKVIGSNPIPATNFYNHLHYRFRDFNFRSGHLAGLNWAYFNITVTVIEKHLEIINVSSIHLEKAGEGVTGVMFSHPLNSSFL